MIGLLVAAFPLAMIAGFAAAGKGVSRGQRRAVLLVSLGLIAAGCVGFILTEDLPALFASRAVMGLGSGGVWIAVTFTTLERWPDQAYLCMSRVFAAYSVGGLVGPLLGAIGGIRGPFVAYLALVLIGAVLALLLDTPVVQQVFRRDTSALRLPGFWLASAGVLFTYVGIGTVEGVLPLHLSTGMTQAAIGVTYVVMSLVVAFASAFAGRFRPLPMLLYSTVLSVAGLALAGLSEQPGFWLAALAIAGFGFGIGNTGAVGILLETVDVERIVTAMVIWSQLGIVGYLLGPLAGGLVAQTLGFEAIGIVPLVGAVGVLAVVALNRAAREG